MTPEQRRKFAQDAVSKRLGTTPPPRTLTADERLFQTAVSIFVKVSNTSLKPILSGLQRTADYSKLGTQMLLMDAFVREFNQLSKDELVRLVSMMHTEELEKQGSSMANAGHIGALVDKNLVD